MLLGGALDSLNSNLFVTNDANAYIKNFSDIDKNNIRKYDPKIYDKIKRNVKYFLSYFYKIYFRLRIYLRFYLRRYYNLKKVIKDLEKFEQGLNILKQYLNKNFIIDTSSSKIIF